MLESNHLLKQGYSKQNIGHNACESGNDFSHLPNQLKVEKEKNLCPNIYGDYFNNLFLVLIHRYQKGKYLHFHS